MTSTITASTTTSAPGLAASRVPAPPTAAPPGRDLACFLLLLAGTDFSGLLHIYGLSWLYAEPLFLGLGWAMVLIAWLLLALPAQERPAWLRFPLRGPGAGAGLALGVVLGALAGGYLLLALSNPPAWVARDPHADTGVPAILGLLACRLAVLIGGPALAWHIAYSRDDAQRRTWLALLAAAFWLLSLVNLLYDAHVGKHASDTWALLAGLGVPTALGLGGLVAAAGGLLLLRPARFLAVAVGAGLALRLAGLWLIPLTINLGDMLPLIGLATTRLLHGQNPYIVYHMPWELPLTYWPLAVLAYLPAAAAGIDLRWTNLLAGPLMGALLVWAGGRRGPGWAAYAFGLLYLAPTTFQWDISTAAPPYWLCLAGACAVAVAVRHPEPARVRALLPGAALGAALAAGPLALPFAPFLWGAWLAAGRRVTVRGTLAAAAVLALLVGPFLLWDAAGFWNGAVAWFNDLNRLPLLKWQTDRSWAFEIGLAGPFWQTGAQAWFKPLQIVLVGGLFIAGLVLRWRSRSTAEAPTTAEKALRWGAAAYLLFMVVNPVIWPYLYFPALLALVFAQVPAAADP